MSLTIKEQEATIAEFQEALARSKMSIQDLAKYFNTSPANIKGILNLHTNRIEEPWILKEFLNGKIISQGKNPVKFSALRGDYHQYWFLDSKIIEKGQL